MDHRGLGTSTGTETTRLCQRPQPGSSDAGGFSLVEVLIASVMVLAIALSTLPMFTRSMVNNTAGMDSTKVANQARGELERLTELPFSSPELAIEAGAERRTSEYFSAIDGAWHPFPEPPDSVAVLWTRTTTIRQYGVAAIADGVIETTEALDAAAAPESVHFKELVIEVQQTGAPFGPAKRITLETLKVK